ncbi:MAG: hypothetical protein WCV81_03680 [Microgenomates group bacterium]|jgi:hypothetical protein
MKNNSSGQVVILLLLIMVVALAIGLSTIGRSILEVSTSRKSEDSSRAFSAAEAAIEKAIKQNENNIGGTTTTQVNPFNLSNAAAASASAGATPVGSNALSFAPYTKRTFAQFWLANPETMARSYNEDYFYLYFGDPNHDKYDETKGGRLANQPAVELDIVYWDDTDKKYKTLKKYYDSYRDGSLINAPRINNTTQSSISSCDVRDTSTLIDDGATANYYCQVRVPSTSDVPSILPHSGNNILIMVRVRLLYTDTEHPVALKPGIGSLPTQANIYRASGTSGDVKRSLEVTNYRGVMPQLFDYVLFSASNLKKE